MAKRTVFGVIRLVLMYAAIAAVLWFAAPTRQSISFGAPLILIGVFVRLWSAGHLIKTTRLITSGPYAYTRNPLYLGRLLFLTGFAIATGYSWVVTVALLVSGWAVFFGYYLPRKERVEPARLLDKHGELYARYRDAVPALRPRLTRWPDAERSRWSLKRMLTIREWATSLIVLTLMIWLMLRVAN